MRRLECLDLFYNGVQWMKEAKEYVQINEEAIIKKAIEHNGNTKQKIVAIEELSELQKEICKELRGLGNIDHITEEIADVEIMLKQLKKMYLIDEVKIEEYKVLKLKRLDDRLA